MMIQISSKDTLYMYNLYHIVKAFFPNEEISQNLDEKQESLVSVKLEEDSCFYVPVSEIADCPDCQDGKKKVTKLVYDWLSKVTGRTLAWGMLTGVRPTKLAMQKLEAGMSRKEVCTFLEQEYGVSNQKAELGIAIAEREKELLGRLDYEQGFSLYVGIPFCPSICSYCSFSSSPLAEWEDRVDDYLKALCQEIRSLGKMAEGRKLNTIYIGGGTPTTLEAEQLFVLLDTIQKSFSFEDLQEFTIEAGRPDSITREKLEVMRRFPVTRISVNPQTMQQKTLDLVGRKHTVQDVKDIFLTVHALAIKRAAKFGQEQRKIDLHSEIEQMVEESARAAERMGLVPYYLYRQKNIAGNFENVGYAKVDKAGIYNILIMEEKQTILAAGAGASTKIVLPEKIRLDNGRETNLIRIENVKNITEYESRIDEMIERKGEWLWR